MQIEQRNFWRKWTTRSAPGAAIVGFVAALSVTPFFGFSGLSIGAVFGISAVIMAVTVVMFVVATGRHHLTQRANMFHVFPRRLHYVQPEHRYEPPMPIEIHFDGAPEDVEREVHLALAQLWPVQKIADLLEVRRARPGQQFPELCSMRVESCGRETVLHVSPMRRLRLESTPAADELFFEVVEELEANGGRVGRIDEPLTV